MFSVGMYRQRNISLNDEEIVRIVNGQHDYQESSTMRESLLEDSQNIDVYSNTDRSGDAKDTTIDDVIMLPDDSLDVVADDSVNDSFDQSCEDDYDGDSESIFNFSSTSFPELTNVSFFL